MMKERTNKHTMKRREHSKSDEDDDDGDDGKKLRLRRKCEDKTFSECVHLLLGHRENDVIEAPLVEMMESGQRQVVKMVLESGGGTLEEINNGNPILLAAKVGDVELVELFLDRGAATIINSVTGTKNDSVLERAAKNGHLPVLKLLFNRRFHVDEGDDDDDDDNNARVANASVLAAQNGHLDIVQFLDIAKHNAVKRVLDRMMIEAVKNGHLQVVKYLLPKFVQHGQCGKVGDMILQNAASNGRMNILEWFTTTVQNAEFDDCDISVNKAICMAVENDKLAAAKLLMKLLDDYHSLNMQTILYMAILNGYAKTLDFALSNGAVLNNLNETLFEAAVHGHVEIARKLVGRGAQLPSPHEYISRKFISAEHQQRFVRTLLKPLETRNPHIPIVAKEQMLRFASFRGFTEMVHILLQDKAMNVN